MSLTWLIFPLPFQQPLSWSVTIELGCRLLGGKAKGMRLETAIFIVTSLLQGLQISLWGLHDNWGSAQILCLHASILLYLMARTGQSSQERLGIMVWLDLIYTSCIFPLKYFPSEPGHSSIKQYLNKSFLKKKNTQSRTTNGWFSLVSWLPWYWLYSLLISLVRSCLLSDNFGNSSSRHLLLYLISLSPSRTTDYCSLV